MQLLWIVLLLVANAVRVRSIAFLQDQRELTNTVVHNAWLQKRIMNEYMYAYCMLFCDLT